MTVEHSTQVVFDEHMRYERLIGTSNKEIELSCDSLSCLYIRAPWHIPLNMLSVPDSSVMPTSFSQYDHWNFSEQFEVCIIKHWLWG